VQNLRRWVRAGAGAAVMLAAVSAGQAAAQGGPAGQASSVQRFDLDPAHTHVGFSARHMLVTNVRGKFNTFRGYIDYDAQDITRSTARIEIDVASIDTNNDRRDEHLRTDDFFNVERFPHIVFVGERVERRGNGLVLVGTLTMRDVTRPVEIPFEMTGPVVAGGRPRIGAEGSLRIDRFDYGVKWSNAIETGGGLVVGPEIRIDLNVTALGPRQ
jgi:polyisoprenoid-binding protein YceI